jgi:CheY-like chemotaxis protein
VAARPVRILIGENDAIVALDIQTQLRRLGYEATIRAGTLREVVTFAKESQPDLIVLNFNICGDTHGFDRARELQQVADIPIVFLSASAQDVRENDPAIPQPYRCVGKPFRLTALHAAIRELLPDL